MGVSFPLLDHSKLSLEVKNLLVSLDERETFSGSAKRVKYISSDISSSLSRFQPHRPLVTPRQSIKIYTSDIPHPRHTGQFLSLDKISFFFFLKSFTTNNVQG